jgi:hypothetical protein
MPGIIVRPSSLQLAEQCPRAPWLGTKFHASRAATRFGSAVDRQVSAILLSRQTGKTDDLPTEEDLLEETTIILDWLEKNYPEAQWTYFVQRRVVLRDPETGEEWTAGTPDILCLHKSEPILVDIDLKKKGQMWAGHLAPPDNNLQQLAYVAAAWLEFSIDHKIEEAHIVLACWDEKGVTPLPNKEPIDSAKLWQVIERIKAVPRVDIEGKQPEACVGEHCDHCYQRMHCDEHLLPLAVVTATGLPTSLGEMFEGALTMEDVAKALAWLDGADRVLREAKKIRDLVEGNVDAFVSSNGPVTMGDLCYGPQEVKGKRRGADIKTLEREGLTRLIRPAETKIKPKWYPANQ